MNTKGKVENTPATEFSVLICVYHGDIPQQLDTALGSIINQTLQPTEIVLVQDGPVSDEMSMFIRKWHQEYHGLIRIVRLAENKGLAKALAYGLEACSFELIGRMDADDFSMPTRFQEQLQFLQNHPDIDVVSSLAGIFQENPDVVQYVRGGPTEHRDIVRLAKHRFPMNHPAAMFRKKAVIEAGNYQDFYCLEDYHLWVRMIIKGSKMATIPKVLYKFRCDKKLIKRRSGFARTYEQFLLHKYFWNIGFISFSQFLQNVIIRTVGCIMPISVAQRLRARLRI